MHGAKSGHLLIYCDAKILLIDFNVLDNKTYSFFIDDQLCEIEVERQGNQFLYGFEINKKADTPRNRQRKKLEKRNLIQSGLMLLGLIALVALTVFGLKKWNKPQTRNASIILEKEGEEGKARILKVSNSEIAYFYIVDGQSYSAETSVEDVSKLAPENGMPLEKGDEFVMIYAPNHPLLNKIDYSRPTSDQIEKYFQRTINQYRSFQPDLDATQVACLVKIAYELKGISGLANCYFQETSPTNNPHHNQNTYNRMIRDIPFQNKKREDCWN